MLTGTSPRPGESTVKRTASLLACILLPLWAARAQPIFYPDGVLNNASYLDPSLPNSGLARGGIFTVFGQGLGPASLARAASFPLPLELAGTSIRVTVLRTTRDAIMLYAVDNQVGAILPSDTPEGEGTLTVTYQGQTNRFPARIRVVRRAFGIFTINQAGSGPGAITDANFATNTLTNAQQPGQIAILWGTGLGPVTFDERTQPPGGVEQLRIQPAPEVLVGGKLAPVLYAGRSPCCQGLDQVVFEVPRDSPEGCYVPVAVRSAGAVSNFASMSISLRGKRCSIRRGFPKPIWRGRKPQEG